MKDLHNSYQSEYVLIFVMLNIHSSTSKYITNYIRK